VSVGWVASDEWWDGVRATLPLSTVLRAVAYLHPLVEAHCASAGGGVDDEGVVAYLRSCTLVGVLPVPHPLLMRRYQPNQYTALWLTTYLWSTVFLHCSGAGGGGRDVGSGAAPLFDAEAIRLYRITVV